MWSRGVLYADHGFWDDYHAWYPMMALLYPERLGEILTGIETMPARRADGFRSSRAPLSRRMTGSLVFRCPLAARQQEPTP
jgi:putative alpha-1,2-mannosidase